MSPDKKYRKIRGLNTSGQFMSPLDLSPIFRKSPKKRKSPPKKRRSPPKKRRSPPKKRRSPPKKRRSPPKKQKSPKKKRTSRMKRRSSSSSSDEDDLFNEARALAKKMMKKISSVSDSDITIN